MANIILIDCPSMGETARKLYTELRGQIDALHQDAGKLESDEQKIRETPAADLSTKHIQMMHEMPLRRLELLRRELVIRRRMQELFQIREADRRRFKEAAERELERVEAEIVADMVKIGFLQGMLPGTEIPSITTDAVSRHPLHHSASLRLQEATNRYISRSTDDDENRAALARLLDAMEKAKQQALHSAA